MVLRGKQKNTIIGIFVCFLFLFSALLFAQPALSQSEPVLVIEPSSAVVNTGESQQYNAYLSYDDGATLGEEVTEECSWTVDDPDIAIAEAEKGLYTGISPGETTIRATFYRDALVRAPIRLAADAELIVWQPPTRIEVWLEVLPQTAAIEVGETQQYEAYLHRTDSAIVENVTEDSTWFLDEDIATPLAKGWYRGDQAGSSLVSATFIGTPEGLTGTYEVTDSAMLRVWEKDIPEDTPDTVDLPEEKILNRQPGYLVWSEAYYLLGPGEIFTMNYDDSITDDSPDRYPRAFYWNETYEKWVALASYPSAPGEVQVINDGSYSGWFVVFGCIQPRFTDVASSWAEPTANRMNGLGLLEGYPDPSNPTSLVRTAGLERTVTRAELTAVVARILGLAPGETHLYPTLTYMSDAENDAVLQANYSDADEIRVWARPYIAAMTEAGLVRGKGDRFAPEDEMTRIEAAVLISDALRDIPDFGTPADLSVFSDADQVPSWAVGQVAEGTVAGYPDGSLRPNQPIKRAESITLLLRLLRGLGW